MYKDGHTGILAGWESAHLSDLLCVSHQKRGVFLLRLRHFSFIWVFASLDLALTFFMSKVGVASYLICYS
jgi:hypothetical protein